MSHNTGGAGVKSTQQRYMPSSKTLAVVILAAALPLLLVHKGAGLGALQENIQRLVPSWHPHSTTDFVLSSFRKWEEVRILTSKAAQHLTRTFWSSGDEGRQVSLHEGCTRAELAG